MSGPEEAMLTSQERAALASLAARAAADDPRLADNLRGLRQERSLAVHRPDVAWMTLHLVGVWHSLRPVVWGPALTIAGLLAVVVGLAVSLVVSVLGVAAALVGVALLVQLAGTRLEDLRREAEQQSRRIID